MHNVSAEQIERNIKLIKIVQKYQCIYNANVSNQSGGEFLDQCWVKVCTEFGGNETVETCKKKWRLLRSSLIRYLKVFKDKSTSKGNRYRPYYLLEHMQFLLPHIDKAERTTVVRRSGNKEKKPNSIKKEMKMDEETIIYTSAPSSGTQITHYNVASIATSSKASSPSEVSMKHEQAENITHFYNTAHLNNVKILNQEEHYVYPQSEELIEYNVQSDEQQEQNIEQHQEIRIQTHQPTHTIVTETMQGQHHHHNDETALSPIKQQQQQQQQLGETTTIIPIPNFNNFLSNAAGVGGDNTADLYFLIGLLPEFKTLSPDQKRKLKIGMLKLIDDVATGSG